MICIDSEARKLIDSLRNMSADMQRQELIRYGTIKFDYYDEANNTRITVFDYCDINWLVKASAPEYEVIEL